jgi:ATP-dependent exoDNAse (exonuclease V) beta subunit
MVKEKTFKHIDMDLGFESLPVEQKSGLRFYKSPNDKWLPSVTTVTGWSKRDFFKEWRTKPGNLAESRRCLTRGNELHQIIEDYINNKEDIFKAKQPHNIELFNQLKPELHRIDNIYAQEVPLWSENVGLAGRVDCVAEFDGELSIIDFKGSTKTKKEEWIENYFRQATAYAIMFQEKTGIEIKNIVIMVACENGDNQIFIKKPINYVKGLYDDIKTFYEEQE